MCVGMQVSRCVGVLVNWSINIIASSKIGASK